MGAELTGYSTRVGAKPNETLADQVCYYARVSNPTSQMSAMNNDRLTAYLIKHRHFSPFQMVDVTLRIDTSRDVARQQLRHSSFAFQEFSQRYSATETTCSTRPARMQDTSNRQSSLDTASQADRDWWTDQQILVMARSFAAYDEALKRGLSKEVARSVLPEGLTWTRLYMSGSLRSWIHYISGRTGPETQLEHREIARECAEEIHDVFPQITEWVHD